MVGDIPNSTGRMVRAIVAISLIFAAIGFLIARQIAINTHAANATQTSCQGTCVMLKADGAQPDSLSVKVGEYVQFNSADGKPHSLSIGKGGEQHEHKGPFTSGEFQSDEAWRVQFRAPGTFTFHDHLNPKINIVVVAYQEGADHTIKF